MRNRYKIFLSLMILLINLSSFCVIIKESEVKESTVYVSEMDYNNPDKTNYYTYTRIEASLFYRGVASMVLLLFLAIIIMAIAIVILAIIEKEKVKSDPSFRVLFLIMLFSMFILSILLLDFILILFFALLYFGDTIYMMKINIKKERISCNNSDV